MRKSSIAAGMLAFCLAAPGAVVANASPQGTTSFPADWSGSGAFNSQNFPVNPGANVTATLSPGAGCQDQANVEAILYRDDPGPVNPRIASGAVPCAGGGTVINAAAAEGGAHYVRLTTPGSAPKHFDVTITTP